MAMDLSFGAKNVGYVLFGEKRGCYFLGIGSKRLRAFSKKYKMTFQLAIVSKKVEKEVRKKNYLF